jgi:ABC-type nickel/cobalt efflux system permease component RcnA
MVAAYLVGTRGTVRDAILLGVVVTISHTAGVYVLGFLTLQLTHFIRAEVIAQWLSLTSGLLVLGMGLWMFQRGLLHYYGIRPMPAMPGHGHSHDANGHSHEPLTPAPAHSHAHAHAEHSHAHAEQAGHSHDTHAHDPQPVAESHSRARRPPRDSPKDDFVRGGNGAAGASSPRADRRGILALGLAGGIVPCYAALALLIAAINLGNVALGLALIAAFSVGMALVLVAVGIVMVKARHLLGNVNQESRWMQALPAASGAVMLCLGIWLTFQSLVAAGVLRVNT